MKNLKNNAPSSEPTTKTTSEVSLTKRSFQVVSAIIKKIIADYYWILPTFYFVIIFAVYIEYGIVFNIAIGIIALVALPIIAFISRSREFLRNSVFFITMILLYELLAALVGTVIDVDNVFYLDFIDKAIFGFNLSAAVQNGLYSPTVTLISTLFYGLHIYLVMIMIVLFWFVSKKIYRGYSYSIILASFLALATFMAFPTAPPWLSGVANDLLNSGYSMLPSSINFLQQTLLAASDKLAAFPSLHAAYITLFAFYTVKLNPKLGFVSIPVFFIVLFSTIYLGQHYVIDLIGGVLYSLIAALIVEKLIMKNSIREDKMSAPS